MIPNISIDVDGYFEFQKPDQVKVFLNIQGIVEKGNLINEEII